MKKIIKVQYGKSQELQRLFGCSAPIVREALRFTRKNDPDALKLAEKIRKAAVEMGGEVFETK